MGSESSALNGDQPSAGTHSSTDQTHRPHHHRHRHSHHRDPQPQDGYSSFSAPVPGSDPSASQHQHSRRHSHQRLNLAAWAEASMLEVSNDCRIVTRVLRKVTPPCSPFHLQFAVGDMSALRSGEGSISVAPQGCSYSLLMALSAAYDMRSARRVFSQYVTVFVYKIVTANASPSSSFASSHSSASFASTSSDRSFDSGTGGGSQRSHDSPGAGSTSGRHHHHHHHRTKLWVVLSLREFQKLLRVMSNVSLENPPPTAATAGGGVVISSAILPPLPPAPDTLYTPIPVSVPNNQPTSEASGEGEDGFRWKSTLRDTCCICMENPVTEMLPKCGHAFCTDCLHHWMQENNTCPQCRTEIENREEAFRSQGPIRPEDLFDEIVSSLHLIRQKKCHHSAQYLDHPSPTQSQNPGGSANSSQAYVSF